MITPSFWRKGSGPRGDPTPGFGSVTQGTYAPFDFMTFTFSCVTLPFNPLFDQRRRRYRHFLSGKVINLIDSVSRNPQVNFKYHSTNGGSLEIIFTFRITSIV